MAKGIGTIIVGLREERGYSQQQLCKNICSVSHMARIEQNESIPDPFLLDRLFSRMGKTTERLEYVLSKEMYELYELQYEIQKEILHRNFDEAETYLEIYEKKKQAKQPLHRQFIEQERVQIAWLCGKQAEEVYESLSLAISETMMPDDVLDEKIALSVEELKLLLFRWEISYGTKYERSLREVWEILEYMEKKEYDAEELVKAYPYAVLLLVKNYEIHTEQVKKCFIEITAKALELLRNEAKLLFMPEILEIHAELLENDKSQEKWVSELREMRKAVLEVEEEFGVNYENYSLFQHLNRAFELDYELIRNSRCASNMSQEELAEDVCAQETLSRIERGKCVPSNKNLALLLKKTKRNRERVGMNIAAERYELLALEKKIAMAQYKVGSSNVNILIKEMKEKLDMSIVENQQYIQLEQIKIEIQKRQYVYEEEIRKLYKILYMTLPNDCDSKCSYNLTTKEFSIINQIATLYCQNNQIKKGIALWKKLLMEYEKKGIGMVFNIREWELLTGNMAGRMEELGYEEETLLICQKRLKTALQIGKGNQIGRSLAIIGCVLERKHNKECIMRFRQTLNFYKLMKLDHRYQCISEYMKDKDIILENV